MRRPLPALFSALLLGTLLAAPHLLAAQDVIENPLLARGARVRVTYAGEDARVGTLVALAPDTLTVEWEKGGGTARMARTRVTRLDVSHGIRSPNKAHRAKIGFAIGAGLGLAIGAVSSKSNPECSSRTCDGIVNGLATVIGAGLLGGVGAAVGAVSGRASERWENARLLPPSVGLVVPARGHGTSVGLALVF
jgi:hypothetical protein